MERSHTEKYDLLYASAYAWAHEAREHLKLGHWAEGKACAAVSSAFLELAREEDAVQVEPSW